MKRWHKTISGTRIYCDDSQMTGAYGTSLRLGHVRNVGPRKWHAELYRTGDKLVLESLQGAKAWVETADQIG